MSKSKLNEVIKKVEYRIKNRDQQLRKNRSNTSYHHLVLRKKDLVNNIAEELLVENTDGEKLRVSNVGDSLDINFIERQVSSYLNSVYSELKSGNFQLKQKNISVKKVTGTPDNFTAFFVNNSGNPRIFEAGVRFFLNDKLGILESKLAEHFGGDSSWSRLSSSTSSVFFNLGHMQGSSISEQGASLFLDSDEKDELITVLEEEAVLMQLEKFGLFNPRKKFIRVTLEGAKVNQQKGASIEAGRITELGNNILDILRTQVDLANLESSPSINKEIIMALEAAAKGRTYKANLYSSTSSVLTFKDKKQSIKYKAPKRTKKKISGPNWSSLITAINQRLPNVVRSNMGATGLVNRTGRFSESVKITDVQKTASGYPSFGMSYDKTPYGVFDRRIGTAPWATPERDPYTLIEKSIRQILKEKAIGRFYLRRT